MGVCACARASLGLQSLGVMLYILVTGGFPFPADSVNTLRKHMFTAGTLGIPWWVSVGRCTVRVLFAAHTHAQTALI